MISQEQIKNIADTLKVEVSVLTDAINSKEEVSLELPILKTFSEQDFATLETNLKKGGYEEGKKAGSEMTAKELKRIAGVEIEGKDLTTIYSAITDKINSDAKIEPNAKVKEMQLSIDALQKTVTEKETELNNVNTTFAAEKLNYTIKSKIPTNKIGLSNDVVLAEMKANGYGFAEDNGVINVTKNGQVLKDTLQNPLKFSDVATQFLSEKNWLTEKRDGRGGSDETGSGITIKSMEDFEAYTQKKGINPNSQEALAVLREAKKENNF